MSKKSSQQTGITHIAEFSIEQTRSTKANLQRALEVRGMSLRAVLHDLDAGFYKLSYHLHR